MQVLTTTLPNLFPPRNCWPACAPCCAGVRLNRPVNDSVTIGELVLDSGHLPRDVWAQTFQAWPHRVQAAALLMKHAERVHSRSQLLDKVWGDHVFIEERTVDVHVKRLREALGACRNHGGNGAWCGYRLTATPVTVAATGIRSEKANHPPL
jgi:DNA-binding response OmpR family regulator